jgi:ribosome-associated toxin RatA of RatAB toxin-antitoxin module
VRSVAVEATTPEGVRRSSWSVLLKGSVLEWVEDEVIDHERRTVDFHQVDGDLERFSGSWVVAAADGDVSLVRLTVDFEIGIPLLADMLNPVAVRALRENSERMLSEIELRAAEMVSDVRDRA